MKTLLAAFSVLTLAQSAFAEPLELFKCTYAIARPNKPTFTMVGTIIPKIGTDEGATYLTLSAPVTTGITVDARILFTGDGYNPMTLHPRGDTAKYLKHTDIKESDFAQLEHAGENGERYSLSCAREVLP